MYCIIDIEHGEYYVGSFIEVINKVYKWKLVDGNLTYKAKYNDSQYIENYTNNTILTQEQIYICIMNLLWNKLNEFGYTRFREVK